MAGGAPARRGWPDDTPAATPRKGARRGAAAPGQEFGASDPRVRRYLGTMIDRFEILASRLRHLLSRNRWSAHLLGVPPVETHADEPGLVMIQVDGLGRAVLDRALREGRMPFLRHLVEDEGHVVHDVYAGIPSNTPAFQAELFYGVPGVVPGFGFIDRELGRAVAMTHQPAAAAVEARLTERASGLLANGASWSNIYTGGAAEAHFCIATAGLDRFLRALHPLRLAGLVVWHFWSVARVLANLVAETVLALWDFARGAIAGRNLRAELRFVPERVLVSAVLREIVTAGACVDAERGLPIVHLNLLGYDEHAHRRGPDSRFALWALRGIDRSIRRIWLAAHRSRNRDYQVWIYSDHGQERVRPWSVVHGEDAADAVRRVWSEFPAREGAMAPEAPEPSRPAAVRTPASPRRTRPASPLGGPTGRPGAVREELPSWWTPGRKPAAAEPPPRPAPREDFHVLHRGPIGFAYVPSSFDRGRLPALAAAVARHGGIPMVLVADGRGAARVFTSGGRELRLPGDEEAVFGPGHPHLEWAMEDTLRLVAHRDAGELVLWGWTPEGPSSFKVENGAHGGPGPRETGAMLVVPPEAAAHVPSGPLRAVDLRDLALGALDPHRSRLPSARTGREPTGTEPLRLMSYNVHACRGMDGRFSVERIARVIARARPDVVCLQEVDQERRRSGRVDQVHEIAGRLAKAYRFHAVSEADDGRFGNAVLSSRPLRLIANGPLPALETRLRLEPRGVLWVEVEVGDARLQVLNTHLSILERERRIQVEGLVEWVDRARNGGPLVLAGDLNATRDSWVGRRLASVLGDVVEPHALMRTVRTWSGRLPLLRIDHVFATPDVHARYVAIPRRRLERAASDHLPLVVDLEIAPGRSGPDAA